MCRNITRTCMKCRKHNPNFFTPILAELPKSRTSVDAPFTNVLIDYCRPYLVYKKRTHFSSPSESHILIIICHSTKAVHAEVVMELNITSTFPMIYCFISRRRPAKSILSDSASPFVSIKRAIDKETSSSSFLTD
jgi:hypothetical protein